MSNVAAPAKSVNGKKAAEEEKIRVLQPSDFEISEYGRARFVATLPSGWAFDEVYKPGFWTYILKRLAKDPISGQTRSRAGSCIEVVTEDHRFYAELYVRAVLGKGVIVQCVGPQIDRKTGKACPVDLQTGQPWMGETAVKSDKYEVQFNAMKEGFDIIDKDDGQVIRDAGSFPIREMAEAWVSKATI